MQTNEYQLYREDGSSSVIVIGSKFAAIEALKANACQRAHLYMNHNGSRRFCGYAYPDGRIVDARRPVGQ